MRKQICLAACALFLNIPFTEAIGFKIPDQNTEATARANAFTATADNPSAVYYNPAGLTQINEPTADLGNYLIWLKTRYESPTGASAHTIDRVQMIPQLYYAHPVESWRTTFGLGIYAPYGFGVEWTDRAPFRTLGTQGEIKYISINPGFGFKITDTLSIGGGVSANYSEADLRQGILTQGDEIKFKGDDITPGFNAGILWQPLAQHSFGVTYRSQTKEDYHGHTTTASVVPFIPSGLEKSSIEFTFPQQVAVGYSFRPTPDWNFEFDIEYVDWSSLNTVELKSASGTIPIKFDWQSSFIYAFGASYTFTEHWKGSLGYGYAEKSVPDATFNPLIPDTDRHVFTVGVIRTKGKTSYGLGYQLIYGPERVVTGSPVSPAGESADGAYSFISHAITLNLKHRF